MGFAAAWPPALSATLSQKQANVLKYAVKNILGDGHGRLTVEILTSLGG